MKWSANGFPGWCRMCLALKFCRRCDSAVLRGDIFGGLALPRILADLTSLISGGLKGVIAR
jgi:hypothetical protein